MRRRLLLRRERAATRVRTGEATAGGMAGDAREAAGGGTGGMHAVVLRWGGGRGRRDGRAAGGDAALAQAQAQALTRGRS